MKILCVSDHIDPVIYSHQIRKRFSHVDIILSAGDLRLTYYDFIVSNLNKPLLFVFGNHRLNGIEYYKKKYRVEPYKNLHRKLKFQSVGGTYIDSRIVKIKGLLIGGLGGSMWYNGGINQFSEAGMFFKMMRMIPRLLWNRLFHGRFIDILLTHSPPRGIHDKKDRCHQGFKVFRLFMKLFKPRYLVHGHVHLYDQNEKRKDILGRTMIINAYDHCIIEVD